MNEKPNYEVGDIVKLKKPHPCGSSQWEIPVSYTHLIVSSVPGGICLSKIKFPRL